MGDPVRVLPLRQWVAQAAGMPGVVEAMAPAYDVGRGVVLVTPKHRLAARLFDQAVAVSMGEGASMLMCLHLHEVFADDDAPARWGHWLQLEPEWTWCSACARDLLAQWTGGRRQCAGCEVDDAGERLRLVRIPSSTDAVERYSLDVWVLLCPRCLGPVTVQVSEW